MFLVVLEIVIGIALLINYEIKWTLSITVVLIVFFTFLTFYSAYFDKVTDCGCFGDAIPLTPWQSFTKDVILVVLVGYLFVRISGFKALLSDRVGFGVLTATTLLCVFLGIRALNHLPFIDFRPYGVGDNIPANMVAPERPIFVYTFEKDGQTIESERYLSTEEGYTYVSHRITNEENTIPKITDYNIWNEELGDYTQQSFVGLKLFLIVYDSKKADLASMKDIANTINGLGAEIEAIALTSSSGDDFKVFLADNNLSIPFFFVDATVLKAMIRSSPGLMLVNEGTVLGKWHFNDTPSISEIKSLL
jgi:hypothetical protein